jgi:aerobic carbon-monoxide dehydrogenase medium subunit
MFVKPFRYERADTLADAAAMLRDGGGNAKVLAGGQSLLPMLNLGILDVEALIDVGHVAGAAEIARDDGYLSIGALATHRAVERDPLAAEGQPLLPAAITWIGSARIRSRGTIGGSLAHSDPAAELPLTMVVAGAEYDLTDGTSTRTVKATEFHESFFTTVLGEDELIERVRVPELGPGWGWGFAEVSRRRGDFALVAAAALVRVAGGAIVESRVGLAGVGERPMRLGAVEIAVEGAETSSIAERVGELEGLDPVTDVSAGAEHRRRLARVLAVRALTDAATRAGDAA